MDNQDSDDDDDDDPSKWQRCYDHKVQGWVRLEDMGVQRPAGCGAAAVGTYLYAWGGEDLEEADPPREPGCMSMHNMASRRLAEVSGPPRALDWCAGVACDGCVYSLGGYDYALRSSVADMYIYNPDIGGWGAGPTLPSAV